MGLVFADKCISIFNLQKNLNLEEEKPKYFNASKKRAALASAENGKKSIEKRMGIQDRTRLQDTYCICRREGGMLGPSCFATRDHGGIRKEEHHITIILLPFVHMYAHLTRLRPFVIYLPLIFGQDH